MPHRQGGLAVYRLLVHGEDSVRVYGSRSFSSLDAALGSVSSAVQSCTEVPQAVSVQRGLPLSSPAFDPLSIVPGKRGGWTDVDWQTVEQLSPELIGELHALPRYEAPSLPTESDHRSQRPAMFAGMATAACMALMLFSVQANNGPDVSAAEASTGKLTELPFRNVFDMEPPAADSANDKLANEVKGPNDTPTTTLHRQSPLLPSGL